MESTGSPRGEDIFKAIRFLIEQLGYNVKVNGYWKADGNITYMGHHNYVQLYNNVFLLIISMLNPPLSLSGSSKGTFYAIGMSYYGGKLHAGTTIHITSSSRCQRHVGDMQQPRGLHPRSIHIHTCLL